MRSCGHTLDEGDDKLGLLTSTYNVFRNMDSARQRMQEDSYLLLRGLLDEDEVISARRCILEQLAAEGQLDPNAPLMHGVPKPRSQMTFRPELAQKNNPPLQHLLYNPEGNLMLFFASFLGASDPAL